MEHALTLSAGCNKWDIRQKVWDYMEHNNLADFPRPVHHRIPNFKTSRQACHNITTLEVFGGTREVKVDPDKPLEGVRLLALQARKTLLVPTPRLRTGLFNRITPPPGAGKEVLRICSTSQVLNIPEELLEDYDLTVDYILTPTRVIKTGCTRPKPRGIIWSKISRDVMDKIPILKKLQDRERRDGKDVTLKNECDAPTRQTGGSTAAAHRSAQNIKSKPGSTDQKDVTTVYVGNIPPATRVSEFKGVLRERGATPLHLTWQGAQYRAFLDYADPCQAEAVVSSLEGLNLGGQVIRVELARTQRSGRQVFGDRKDSLTPTDK
ncbi:methenyltetrahydrofolate synthase domain-containing protein isoform X4 [Mixophyes fleayi]|uniref:methenyltetrahydrofolate synthase domain-containing protein isoform X4 n=1 Tax=Mixophyes fleayi TaxID=3061075 RepID=UPI003F4DF759